MSSASNTASFSFRKKTPKKRKVPESGDLTNIASKKSKTSFEDLIPSRPAPIPIPEDDLPELPQKNHSTKEKTLNDSLFDASHKVTALEQLISDTLVAHPPVAVPPFMKPHLKDIALLLLAEAKTLPALPSPPSNKEISTNEATLNHLRLKEKCLDTLIARFEGEKKEWEGAQKFSDAHINHQNIKQIEEINTQEDLLNNFSESSSLASASATLDSVHKTLQKIEKYCEHNTSYCHQTTKKLVPFNLANVVPSNPKQLLQQLIQPHPTHPS